MFNIDVVIRHGDDMIWATTTHSCLTDPRETARLAKDVARLEESYGKRGAHEMTLSLLQVLSQWKEESERSWTARDVLSAFGVAGFWVKPGACPVSVLMRGELVETGFDTLASFLDAVAEHLTARGIQKSATTDRALRLHLSDAVMLHRMP